MKLNTRMKPLALCLCAALLVLAGLVVASAARQEQQPPAEAPAAQQTLQRQRVLIEPHVVAALPEESASAEPEPAQAPTAAAAEESTQEQPETAPAAEAAPETAAEPEAAESEEPAAEPELELLGSFIATAYCQTGTTATGTYTTAGRTLAVNPGMIPYGTHVWLYLEDGTLVGDYYAEDTGSNLLAHPRVIDIYMGTDYDACIQWGAQNVNVYVEKTAN